jgi:hypothetical protein
LHHRDRAEAELRLKREGWTRKKLVFKQQIQKLEGELAAALEEELEVEPEDSGVCPK